MTRRRASPVWQPLSFLQALLPLRSQAGEFAERWVRAFRAEPELARDLIRTGGLLAAQPQSLEGGLATVDQLDPLRLAYEAGRRDLALSLLAAGNIDRFTLSDLLEPDHD